MPHEFVMLFLNSSDRESAIKASFKVSFKDRTHAIPQFEFEDYRNQPPIKLHLLPADAFKKATPQAACETYLQKESHEILKNAKSSIETQE